MRVVLGEPEVPDVFRGIDRLLHRLKRHHVDKLLVGFAGDFLRSEPMSCAA